MRALVFRERLSFNRGVIDMQQMQKWLALAATLTVTSGALAQQYPTRVITMLVPYAAGGPTDTVARVVAQSMSKPLGQTIVVENQPSAGGITAPAMNDLLGGQVDFMCDQTTNTTAQIKGGKVKVYGVTSKTRVASLPDIRTLDEQGLKGFEVGIWHGLYGPKGMPKPVLDKLVAALQDTVKDADVKKRFADLGATTMPPEKATPAALQEHLKAEMNRWGPLIKKAGVYAD